MKTAALLCSLMLASVAHAHAGPVATIGIGFSTPEIFGIYASLWPTETITIDARATLATLDGGATVHIPVAESGAWRHDILVHGMAGWAGLPYHLPYNGVRLAGLVGYGLLGTVDLRFEAGLSGGPSTLGAWGPGFVALAMVGYPL